jgi:hypothetical protein
MKNRIRIIDQFLSGEETRQINFLNLLIRLIAIEQNSQEL